ncbi:MarR family winged helix-turn-helix transcriptional regulator [Nocardia nova]|uniref:MarR family winged helix-turn-helix transcriptional regulator n=1 Tax=Nocardia nova TaxID=37330 RepID=UPI00046C8FB2|nr:MarR family transcriptional regulator [Nocardia nova]
MREEDVRRFQRQLKLLYRRVRRERPATEGRPLTDLQMLAALDRAAEPLRPSELADELDMARSNVASTLRSLEADGLIERRGDPTDGRKAFITISDSGRRMVTVARRGWLAWLQHAIDDELTAEEQDILLRAADLMQRLSELPESAALPR